MDGEFNGGSAFPRFQREHIYRDAHDRSGENQFIPKDGMSLRDYFAGQALVGLLANPNSTAAVDECADDAYTAADAMLAERVKGGA